MQPDSPAPSLRPSPVPAPRTARAYGRRARIGLVVPSPNTVAETEFWRMAPDGVTIHTARLTFDPDEPGSFAGIDGHLPRALAELRGAEVDVIAYACTASSLDDDPGAVARHIEANSGIPAVATGEAVVAALRLLGARRIAFGTPYMPEVNAHERAFFAAQGFEVLADEALVLFEGQTRMRHMCLVPPAEVDAMGRRLADSGAEAVFLSCTDMATLPVIAGLEAATGMPVVTSTQATFWRALRVAGIDDPVPGAGRLLAG